MSGAIAAVRMTRISKKTRAALAISLMFAGGALAAECKSYSGDSSSPVGYNFGTAVESPFGRYLYIRSASAACAIRFLKICSYSDAKEPSRFTDGLETIEVEFEIYSRSDGELDLNDRNTSYRSGKLRQAASVGPGRHLSVSPGAIPGVKCGDNEIMWLPPFRLSFYVRNRYGSFSETSDLSMAPTAVVDRSRIDMRDARIQWFRSNGSIRGEEIRNLVGP